MDSRCIAGCLSPSSVKPLILSNSQAIVIDMLKNKYGLVTGGASGIGRACAIRIAREGGAVVISDLESSRDKGEDVVKEIQSFGGTATFFCCDVAKEADNEALVNEVVSRYGALNFALNNAGIGHYVRLAETEAADFDRVIAINLRGTFLGMKYQIKQMLKNGGGAIVNTSSSAGLRAVNLLGAYSASKHGILGLTKSGALEYANDGIRVNAVCPGAIMTPLMEVQSVDYQNELVSPQAMSRFGLPEEVAAVVVWLCSDESSFVTGVSMPVDGGGDASY